MNVYYMCCKSRGIEFPQRWALKSCLICIRRNSIKPLNCCQDMVGWKQCEHYQTYLKILVKFKDCFIFDLFQERCVCNLEIFPHWRRILWFNWKSNVIIRICFGLTTRFFTLHVATVNVKYQEFMSLLKLFLQAWLVEKWTQSAIKSSIHVIVHSHGSCCNCNSTR